MRIITCAIALFVGVIKQHAVATHINFSVEVITITARDAHMTFKLLRRIGCDVVNHATRCKRTKFNLASAF